MALTGHESARVVTAVPGPRSRALAERLRRVESPNVTAIGPDGPIFWSDAAGAIVRDVDDNVFIDLTAGFGVANAGQANPAVAGAIAAQATRLPHALGDVHPAEPKVRLLEALARIAPGDLSLSVLGSAGAEAVEAALKTAQIHTGRPGVIAFEHAYHGLTFGALATTWRADFRTPFGAWLAGHVRFAPYPGRTGDASLDRGIEDAAIAAVRAAIDAGDRDGSPVGAVLVEPVQGRGGIVVPTDTFLSRLRSLCDGRSTILIFDEIYTGLGRTGRWFASEHWDVVPDVLCAGKALTGSVPLSAAIGSPAVMGSWPPSAGEAIHTSTFLGNPVACAAALAQIDQVERLGLLDRAARVGQAIAERTADWVRRFEAVTARRGIGLLQAAVVPGRALEIAAAAQREGVLVLAEGDDAEVLALTPPAVIGDGQLDHALDVIERLLER